MSSTRKPRPKSPTFTPVAVAARSNGWTPEKQGQFIDALAESGCVHEACKAVSISRQAAYALRRRPDAQAFRIAWDAAIDYAIRRLTDECLSRALNGEVVPRFYKGEQVGEYRRYDNKLAMFLMRYRDPLRYAATLDEMIYAGHPETVALSLARARDAAADAAHGCAPAPRLDQPYTYDTVANTLAEAATPAPSSPAPNRLSMAEAEQRVRDYLAQSGP